ncbi:hypothetical protein CKF74_05425 [Corynebacterium striatum]|nr:hypothetical protein CKF74_05425 [Corynebacterium striatum]
MPEDLAADNARLRRENQELRDTNELLKAASAFFASELDPKRNARLRRENQELRDTNELLKAASAFFASELDPKRRK